MSKIDNLAGAKYQVRIKGSSYKNKDGKKVCDTADFFIDSRYKIERILGKGSYGVVCSAIDTKVQDKSKPTQIAIKKVFRIFSTEVLLTRAVRELRMMRHFKGHRNIISLIDLDIVYTEPYDGLYCYQELVEHDLAHVIQCSRVQFSEFHIQSFLYQILCGLKYIHSADVIHRDLKPGNILCTSQGVLKICDFGLARGVSPQFLKPSRNTITNYVATRWYRAPELILSRRSYGKPVDLWAVGCIFGEFYGRKPMFMGSDQIEQITKIVQVLGTPSEDVILRYCSRLAWEFFSPPNPQYHPVRWPYVYRAISESGSALLEKLLCWDIKKRATVEEALGHEFLASVRNPSNEPVCGNAFDFSFENSVTSLSGLKALLKKEVDEFKKEAKREDE